MMPMRGGVCAKFWAPVAQVLSCLSMSLGGCDSRARHGCVQGPTGQVGPIVLKQRHPDLVATMIHELEHGQSFTAVRECRGALVKAGLDAPSWGDLLETLSELVEDPEPNAPEFGWQQRATRPLEVQFFQDSLWPFVEDPERALMRSQHGPLASTPLTTLPTSRVMRLDVQTALHLQRPDAGKSAPHPELSGEGGRARFVVLGAEGGVLKRPSFWRQLAAARVVMSQRSSWNAPRPPI